MKKSILTLAMLTALSATSALAEEATAEDPDMADPTAVYAYAGAMYGNKGLDIEVMGVLSKTETQRSGFIFEAKDILDGDSKRSAVTGNEVNSRNFRLRYGSINTTNGLGGFVDAVAAEHPFFGNMVAAQAGPVMTIPVGDDIYIWPMLLVGGVVAEDNTDQFSAKSIDAQSKMAAGIAASAAAAKASATAQIASLSAGDSALVAAQKGAAAGAEAGAAASKATYAATSAALNAANNVKSEGMDWMATTGTAMAYIRYQPHDDFFALGSIRYTKSLAGKDFSDKVADGGLQMASSAWDLKLGYYLTKTQTITMYYSGDNTSADDKYSLGYKYAF